MKAAIAVLFVTLLGRAFACSCGEARPPTERQGNSTAVFIGTLLSHDETGPMRVLEFSVSEAFKGTLSSKVLVSTPKEESKCGVRLSSGATYLIFAGGPMDRLVTTLCRANRAAASDIGQAEIAILRRHAKSSQ